MYGALNNEIRNLLKSYHMVSSKVLRRDLYEEFLRRCDIIIYQTSELGKVSILLSLYCNNFIISFHVNNLSKMTTFCPLLDLYDYHILSFVRHKIVTFCLLLDLYVYHILSFVRHKIITFCLLLGS